MRRHRSQGATGAFLPETSPAGSHSPQPRRKTKPTVSCFFHPKIVTALTLAVALVGFGLIIVPLSMKTPETVGPDQIRPGQQARQVASRGNNELLRSSVVDESDATARGPNALPASLTPALVGSRRGHIECDVNVDDLAYWNDPQGVRDRNFRSPFSKSRPDGKTKYLSFEPDRGGWNNIRMSMENMVVFAAATGRTLVLPPDQPLYLLKNDPKKKQRGFADFFDLHKESFSRIVPVITSEEFIRREGSGGASLSIPSKQKDGVLQVMNRCEHRAKSNISCFKLYDYYRKVGFVPQMHGEQQCLVFDEDSMNGTPVDAGTGVRIRKFCGTRQPVYYSTEMQNAQLVHFQTSEKETRILNHFYTFLFFTDPAVDNFYKRLIRDHVRYRDSLFCAAGKIVHALQKDGKARGFALDEESGGGYSSMHIRRGDFQWKKTRISGDEWYENTKKYWFPNEILYIATDERNRTFFDPIAKYYDVRFLDDFFDLAGLGDLDPNYFGMIETIVASRGRIFVGTYFSSFTGYISRMRGYHGMSGKKMWYGQRQHAAATQEFVFPKSSYSAREFPVGWVSIDGDNIVTTEK